MIRQGICQIASRLGAIGALVPLTGTAPASVQGAPGAFRLAAAHIEASRHALIKNTADSKQFRSIAKFRTSWREKSSVWGLYGNPMLQRGMSGFRRPPLISRGLSLLSRRNPSASSDNQSTMQRLRTLFKEYGRPAVGVYLGISAVDLSLSFVAVYMGVEVDKVVDWAKVILAKWGIWDFAVDKDDESNLRKQIGDAEADELHRRSKKVAQTGQEASNGPSDGHGGNGTSGNGNSNGNGNGKSLMTTFLIAYAFHKLLLPIRVPITMALTPPVVRYLRRWGWMKDVGAISRVLQSGGASEGSKKATGTLLGVLAARDNSVQ